MNRAEKRKLNKRVNSASDGQLKAEVLALKAELDAVMNEIDDYIVMQKNTDFQNAMDFLAVALHESEGFGEERTHRVQLKFQEVFERFTQMSIEDYGLHRKCLTPREIHLGYRPDLKYGDSDTAYTHAMLDRQVKEATGKYFEPYDVRYEMEYLYINNRKKLLEKVKNEEGIS